MIEELREYLVRHGWDDDIADDIHDAYYVDGMAGVAAISEGYGEDDLLKAVADWKREVGED